MYLGIAPGVPGQLNIAVDRMAAELIAHALNQSTHPLAKDFGRTITSAVARWSITTKGQDIAHPHTR